MCLCCLGAEVIPPTEKGKTFKFVLSMMMIPQAIVAVLNFIAFEQFLLQAFFGLMFLLILYMIQHQCSYQGIMLYIFISIFFAVTFMVYFVTPIQNEINPSTYTGKQKFIYAVSIISFAYYLFALIFCFYPYRQFKAIAFQQNPALRNYFQGEGGENIDGDGGDRVKADNPNVRNVDYEANYGDIEYDRKKRNNDHGTFEVFKGQGVKIG